MKRVFIALLLVGSFFASHCKEVHVNLLAVVGNEGENLTGNVLSAILKPIGHEKNAIFLEVLSTKYDEALQQSLENAYNSAKRIANTTSCSFLVDFVGGSRELGGPSGGLVFALSFYNGMTDESLPLEDYGITGAIDSQGNVYPVGGVIEKVEAALKSNLTGVIIPITDRFDYIFSFQYFDMERVHYVLNLKDAIEVLKGGNGVNPEKYLFALPPVEKKEASPYTYEFAEYYEKMKETYLEALANLEGKLPVKAQEYYANLLERADSEASLGYYYTASNDIFVSGGELLAFDGILNGRELKEEAEECIKNIEVVDYTKSNFEFVAGAKFRLQRALNRLNAEKEGRTLSERAYIIRDYAEALEWCEFSSQLLKNAKTENSPRIVQDMLRSEYMREIQRIDPSSLSEEDNEFYISSLLSAASGDYVAALYHLAYLKADLGEDLEIDGFKSFWGKVFASQAEYTGDKGTLLLAKQLENTYRFIKSASAVNELSLNIPQKSESLKQQVDLIIYSQIVVLGLLMLGVILWLKKR